MTDQELTIALAEKFGFAVESVGDCVFTVPDEDIEGDLWSPLTDWNDAMELAEKWQEGTDKRVTIQKVRKYWGCDVEHVEKWGNRCASGPRAVTLTIARAVGIEL